MVDVCPFLRRYKQILRFFPLLFYLQFPWGKRWSFAGWNFKNFRTKARWGTATWSTSWDVVASWSLATMRSCFLDFAVNDGFGENSQAVNVNPGVSLFREIWRSKPFPGGCGYLRNLLGCPSSYPDPGRKVVEILRMHTYTETLTWCTKWTADVSQKQKALNSTTVSYTACLHHDHDTARFYSRKIC